MIVFEPSNINPNESTVECMIKLRSYLEETADKLNMLSEQVAKLEKERDK